jgi:hypothetical protein
MGPHLLEQVSAFLGWERFDQLLFGRGQDTLKAHHQEITDQVGVYVLGPPADVFLFEAGHPVADGSLDFALGLHGSQPEVQLSVVRLCLTLPRQRQAQPDYLLSTAVPVPKQSKRDDTKAGT